MSQNSIPDWVRYNNSQQVVLATTWGIYDTIVELSKTRTARQVVQQLRMSPRVSKLLDNIGDSQAKVMVRAVRDDAGVAPQGPPMLGA